MTQPDQLQITIYETSLEHLIPLKYKRMSYIYLNLGCLKSSWNYRDIYPDIYELRYIHYVSNCWNKKQPRYEIFFDTASRLKTIFNSDSPKNHSTIARTGAGLAKSGDIKVKLEQERMDLTVIIDKMKILNQSL
ncbi:7451_t:CDS:2 [Cetraspora pellucida]|uniref:7451_t:CDS:1 n=1 Tax=Cetraspora pellucida TaxID=1433469 RepID=A0A9N9EI74_9GLOM|nr:7451_t:CDS:2 [Cetraspora pellucida]